jgi:hypothetical protein
MTSLVPAQPRSFSELGWPGRRFRVLRDLGQPRDFMLLGYGEDRALVEAHNVHHEDHDGMSAMRAWLRQRGVDVAPQTVAGPAASSTLAEWWRLFQYLRHNRTVVAVPKRPLREERHVAWPAAAVAVLSATQTTSLLAACRAQNATLTSWLLSRLDAHASKLCLDHNSPRTWMVPVNTRTEATKTADNAVGAMLLPFFSAREPSELSSTMRHHRDHDLPFGPFVLVTRQMSRTETQLRVQAQRRRFERPLFGLLTNVGVWPGLPGIDAVAIAPPVSQSCWFGCAVVTSGGKLSLCIRAHACLGLAAGDIEALMRTLVADVEAAVGSDVSMWMEHSTASEHA